MKLSHRITLGQLMFMRAVLQGIPLKEAAHRYLDGNMDARSARRELQLIRAELVAAAKRAEAWGDARALTLDMSSLPVGRDQVDGREAKPLEAFRAEVDPFGNYYSESELLALYQDQYPVRTTRYEQRIRRLRERQLRTLRVLERVLVAPPTLNDPIGSWFDVPITQRCASADLYQLSDLWSLMQRRGALWYKQIPRLGVTRAAKIQAWVIRNGRALTGEAISATLFETRQPMTTREDPSKGGLSGVIAPMERFKIPSALSGQHGLNRLDGVSTLANNDYEAIQAWLAAVGAANATTARQYAREAERLLLWSVTEQGRAVSSLQPSDVEAYQSFLRSPGADWINPERVFRSSPDWRPFRQSLSEKSAAYSLRVVGLLFAWLTERHYLAENVWRAGLKLLNHARASAN